MIQGLNFNYIINSSYAFPLLIQVPSSPLHFVVKKSYILEKPFYSSLFLIIYLCMENVYVVWMYIWRFSVFLNLITEYYKKHASFMNVNMIRRGNGIFWG